MVTPKPPCLRKIFPSEETLEANANEMMSIYASMKNEMLLLEQTRRSLIQTKTELENQVGRLRNDVALAERDLSRAKVSFA